MQQDQEEYPFLATLYAVRIQTRRSLDRHYYTHIGELHGSTIHAISASVVFIHVVNTNGRSLSEAWCKIP